MNADVYISLAILAVLLFGVTWWSRRRDKGDPIERTTITSAYIRGVYQLGSMLIAHTKAVDIYVLAYRDIRARDKWKPVHRPRTEKRQAQVIEGEGISDKSTHRPSRLWRRLQNTVLRDSRAA